MNLAEEQSDWTIRWLKRVNIYQLLVHVVTVYWCSQLSFKHNHVATFLIALAPWVFGNLLTAIVSLSGSWRRLQLVVFTLTQINGAAFLMLLVWQDYARLEWALPTFVLLMSISWGAFISILYRHIRAHMNPLIRRTKEDPPWSEVVQIASADGKSLRELSTDNKLLVMLVRHQGCTFCREALADMRDVRDALKDRGYDMCVVHMSTVEQGRAMLDQHGLAGVHHFSDSDCVIYRAFDLQRGSFWQLLAPLILWRGLNVAIFRRLGFGPIVGDAFQMGGAFVLDRGEIVEQYRTTLASDRSDLCELAG